MLVDTNLYKKSSKTQKIRCEICANYCKIAEGNVGVCRQHKNVNGELFDLSYGIGIAAIFALLVGIWIWVFPETKGTVINELD